MDLGLFLIRLVLGVTLVAHGTQKLFGWFGGHGVSGTAGFMGQLGFRPARVHAMLAGAAELGGGILLVLGLLTPFGSALVIAVMIVAIGSVHLPKGFFVTDGGYEFTLLLAAVAAGLGFTGPGAWSLDGAFGIDWEAGWGTIALIAGLIGGLAALGMRRSSRAQPTG